MAPAERVNENIKSVFQVFNLDIGTSIAWRVLIERNDKTFSDLLGQVTMTMDFWCRDHKYLGIHAAKGIGRSFNDENSQEIASLNSNRVLLLPRLGNRKKLKIPQRQCRTMKFYIFSFFLWH